MFNHKTYNRKRYHKRRKWMFGIIGNICVKCGAIATQIDHINPKEKSFDVSTYWSKPKVELLIELKKCQPLCKNCHGTKTLVDVGKKLAKGTHGTLSAYRYCKCDLCRKVKSDYMKKYKKMLV